MSTTDRIRNSDDFDWLPAPWRTTVPRTSGLAPSELRSRIRDAIGVVDAPAVANDVRVHRSWTRTGQLGTELSWDAGIGGPRTAAWLLRPAMDGVVDKPAVLLLHGHDGMKYFGRHKVADGPDPIPERVRILRERGYDGLAVASGLVAAGFVVLVHDVFPWGSRAVPWEQMPTRARSAPDGLQDYEAAARELEHGLMKRAVLAGSSLAALSVHEDLVALDVLYRASGVDRDRIAAVGFSGGGARAAHLVAYEARLAAVVVSAMTSTFEDIRTSHADDTTWLLATPGLATFCDWPDVIASGAPVPLLVQLAEEDSHFGYSGMDHARARIEAVYGAAGSADRFEGSWYGNGHRFTGAMQRDAASWLNARLSVDRS